MKENGCSIEITTKLEHNSYFEVVFQGIIIEKHSSEYPLYQLKSYIYDENVRKIIYDEQFIISCLYRMQLKKAKDLESNL